MSTIVKSFQVFVPALHEAAVHVAQPPLRGRDKRDADADQNPGGCLLAEHGLQHEEQQERHSERSSRDEVLHPCTHVLAAAYLGVQVKGLVVVHSQLEHAAVHGTGDKHKPGGAHQRGHLARYHARNHQRERDDKGQAIQDILGTQQRVYRLLPAHQAVDVVALIAHEGREEQDAEDDVIVEHEEVAHASVVDVGEADGEAEYQYERRDGVE